MHTIKEQRNVMWAGLVKDFFEYPEDSYKTDEKNQLSFKNKMGSSVVLTLFEVLKVNL